MRRLCATALLVSAMAVVSACGSDESPSSAASGESSGDAPALRLGMSSYSGYGPYFIGVEKGYFQDAGVDLQPQIVGDDALQRATMVRAGKLDGFTTTVDTIVNAMGKGIPLEIVTATDTSDGADGVIATKDIPDVSALRGKEIAVQPGTTTQFLLATVLDGAGLSLDDIEQTNLSPSDAGAAFAAGKVEVAATWEPWLTKAAEKDGQVLASSKELPGVITDAVAVDPEYAKEHPDALRALAEGWDKSVAFLESNPDEALEIMAQGLDLDVADLKSQLETIKLFSTADAQAFFGTAEQPGDMYDLVTRSADFWTSLGEIEGEVDAQQVVDPSFVNDAR
jgi:NitT/TauT family transport system substrate-binding protein